MTGLRGLGVLRVYLRAKLGAFDPVSGLGGTGVSGRHDLYGGVVFGLVVFTRLDHAHHP